MSQKLTFTTACMSNTTVSNATDTIYYDIKTPEWEPHSTTVRRLDPHTGMYELTGYIESEPGKPVSISLHGGELQPEEGWVRKIDGPKPGESQWQFNGGEGNVLAWRVMNRRLELYGAEEGVENNSPLATFYQHKRHLMVGMISQQAYLEVDNSTIESLDATIVSFLIVERKRRAGTLV